MNEWQKDWSKFIFEYECSISYGWSVKVVVDIPFDHESELRPLGGFPVKQKKMFAEYVLDNFETEKYHILQDKDFMNPFAKYVKSLFKSGVQIYWMKRPRDSILIISDCEPVH